MDTDGVRIRDRFFPYQHCHGDYPLDPGHVDSALLRLLGLSDDDEGEAQVARLRFLDIEATGLGGAGAMVFLVAVGWWEPGRFVLRQYLAPSPATEGALLGVLVRDLFSEGEPVLVTYNGSTYDAPLLDSRGTMHRLRSGLELLPHLDLLKAVRRGLGAALRPHRLSHIEATLLGVVRHEDEVGGADVPGWYFRFLRSGDARMLVPIVEHNAADVLSLAVMVARLAEVSCHAAEGSPFELLMLGRLHARSGSWETALAYLRSAEGHLESRVTRELLGFEMAAILRRVGRRAEAASLWEQLASGVVAPTFALVELAKHFEHQDRDFERALNVVDRALALQPADPALEHRRARIMRRAHAIG
jgi:uncharacterized protein YprB with RNaseH-like and TPR domain